MTGDPNTSGRAPRDGFIARRRAALILALCFGLLGVYWAGQLESPRSVQAVMADGGAMANAGWERALPRFRVIGHSDDPADQAVKLKVRDRLLPEMARIARSHGGWAQTPWADYLTRLETLADDTLREEGFGYGARAEWLRESTPNPRASMEPAPIALPIGAHPTLKIVLGQGTGANWWCVLFPPLCFVDAFPGVELAPAHGSELSSGGAAATELAAVGAEVPPIRVGFKVLAALRTEDEREAWWSSSSSSAQGRESADDRETADP